MNITQSLDDINLDSLEDEIRSYNESADLTLVRDSYFFSEMKHRDQKRMSGEPYFSHCKATARDLISWRMDVDSLAMR